MQTWLYAVKYNLLWNVIIYSNCTLYVTAVYRVVVNKRMISDYCDYICGVSVCLCLCTYVCVCLSVCLVSVPVCSRLQREPYRFPLPV